MVNLNIKFQINRFSGSPVTFHQIVNLIDLIAPHCRTAAKLQLVRNKW